MIDKVLRFLGLSGEGLAVSATNPLPTAKKLLQTQVGTDKTATWANSAVINTYYAVEITAPTTPDEEYEVIIDNPSQDTNLYANIFNKETSLGGINKSALLYGPIYCAKVVPAAIQQFFSYNAAGAGTYTDDTTDINDTDANDVAAVPIAQANDANYFGDTIPFNTVKVTVGTAGVYVATLVWEYYNGSAWAAIPGVTDGTSGFTASGSVVFSPPSDWATVAVNSSTKYWIRCRVSAFTSVATPPLITQAWSISEKCPSATATIVHGIFNGGNARIVLYNDTAVSSSGAFTATVRVREVV
jgi:hypothetical protein